MNHYNRNICSREMDSNEEEKVLGIFKKKNSIKYFYFKICLTS